MVHKNFNSNQSYSISNLFFQLKYYFKEIDQAIDISIFKRTVDFLKD